MALNSGAGAGGGASVIIFTGSLEASHRLAALLPAFRRLCRRAAPRGAPGPGGADGLGMGDGVAAVAASRALSSAQFSSSMTHAQRAAALEGFRAGKVRVLIASDAATRGIDIDNVDVVVNYDAPVFARTYVHRVGRTARMGRAGTAVTIMGRHEVRHFKSIVRKNASSSSLADFSIDRGTLDQLRPAFERALAEVQGGGAPAAGRGGGASDTEEDEDEDEEGGRQDGGGGGAAADGGGTTGGRLRLVSREMKIESAASILRRQFRSNLNNAPPP